MSSSSTEPRSGFLPADRASWVRLTVVLAFAAAAIVGPLVASTSASFSDEQQVGVTLTVPPDPSPTPTPTP